MAEEMQALARSRVGKLSHGAALVTQELRFAYAVAFAVRAGGPRYNPAAEAHPLKRRRRAAAGLIRPAEPFFR
jgi:hypothetical protein